MRSVTLTNILVFILLFGLNLSGQELDPAMVLDAVQSRLDYIEDYQVDIEIEVDVDYIRMPVKHAKMYYRQPDIVDFESEEFFMLPKKGMSFSLDRMLSKKYTAIFTGYEYINQEKQYSLKIIPIAKDAEFILATVWIDPVSFLLTRIATHTRKHGSYLVDFSYGNPELPLPSEMTVTFELAEFNTPVRFLGKEMRVDMEIYKESEAKEGRVIIRYSNYLINQRIPVDDPQETRE